MTCPFCKLKGNQITYTVFIAVLYPRHTKQKDATNSVGRETFLADEHMVNHFRLLPARCDKGVFKHEARKMLLSRDPQRLKRLAPTLARHPGQTAFAELGRHDSVLGRC